MVGPARHGLGGRRRKLRRFRSRSHRRGPLLPYILKSPAVSDACRAAGCPGAGPDLTSQSRPAAQSAPLVRIVEYLASLESLALLAVRRSGVPGRLLTAGL